MTVVATAAIIASAPIAITVRITPTFAVAKLGTVFKLLAFPFWLLAIIPPMAFLLGDLFKECRVASHHNVPVPNIIFGAASTHGHISSPSPTNTSSRPSSTDSSSTSRRTLLLLFQSGIHLALKRRHDLSDLFGRIGIIVGCILHDFTFVGSCCAVAAVLELLLIVVVAGF